MGIFLAVDQAVLEKENENLQLEAMMEDLNILVSNLNAYIGETELESEVYNNHKVYIADMQIPTLCGLIELCRNMITANKKYIDVVVLHFNGMCINQDSWEDILKRLTDAYNSLNTTFHKIEAMILSALGAEYTCKSAGILVEANLDGHIHQNIEEYSYDYQSIYSSINSYAEELYVLRSMISKYKLRLMYLDIMNSKLYGLYYNVEILKNAVASAVNQLKNVPIDASGEYYPYLVAEYSVFSELENCIIGINIANEINTQLGDDYVSMYNDISVDVEQQTVFLANILNVVADFVPSLCGKVGRIEIPLAPGLTIYYENSVTVNSADDIPVECTISMNESAEYIANNSINVENLSVGSNGQIYVLSYEYDIDIYSSCYVKFIYNNDSNLYTMEYGVNSVVGDVVHNTDSYSETEYFDVEAEYSQAIGIIYDPTDSGWVSDEVDQSIYSPVAAPVWQYDPHSPYNGNCGIPFINFEPVPVPVY